MRIGIDLGGTKIEGIVLDGDKEVARQRISTPRGDYQTILHTINELIIALESTVSQQCTIGIGGPGSINNEGLLRNSNTTELNGKPFIRDLENLCEHQIRFSNDANCFALAEAVTGAAKDFCTVFGVILGTGVGGALIVDKKILVGTNAVGGEWGHNQLPWMSQEERSQSRPCYCGKSHCIETFLSGPGLSLTYQLLTGKSSTGKDIVELSKHKDSDAIQCLDKYIDQLARALASVINIFDPECIVLGGGLSNIELLYLETPKCWSSYVFSDHIATQLLTPKGGDSAGVVGAAWLWP